MTIKSRVKRLLTRSPRMYSAARRIWRRSPFYGQTNANRFWDRQVDAVEDGSHRGWLDSQFVEDEYIRPQVSGDSSVYYLSYFFDTHYKDLPISRGLSLGCGGGNLERALIDMGVVEYVEAMDASASSVALAERLAEQEGKRDRIQYSVANIDQVELKEDHYDFVVCKMSLHHFEALEHVYRQIAASLRPGGLFMFNEFVGPTRHQWTEPQLRLMNQLLDSVPNEVRSKIPIHRIERPTVREMIAADPSESVRSSEIMPLLEHDFDVIEYKPYGGTLLQVFLQEVLPALDLERPADQELVRGWFEFERSKLAAGEIDSDFAYVVAKARR